MWQHRLMAYTRTHTSCEEVIYGCEFPFLCAVARASDQLTHIVDSQVARNVYSSMRTYICSVCAVATMR